MRSIETSRCTHLARKMYLDTPDGRQLFEDLLNESKPNLVFIDSLNKIIRKSISDDDAVRPVMTYLSNLCTERNLTLVILHHDRKRQVGQKTTELDDVYGSRFLTSECDFVMTLSKTEDRNQFELHYVKSRYGNPVAPKIIERYNGLNYQVVNEVAVVRPDSAGEPSFGDPGEPPSALFVDQ